MKNIKRYDPEHLEKDFVNEIGQVLERYGIDDPDFMLEAHALPSRLQNEELGAISVWLRRFSFYLEDNINLSSDVFEKMPIKKRMELIFDAVAEKKALLDHATRKAELTLTEKLDLKLSQKLPFVKIDTGDIIKDASLSYRHGYYIFGAAANVGKTNTLINIAVNCLREKCHDIIYFSIDDSAEEIAYRIMACFMDCENIPVKVPAYAMPYLQYNADKEAVRQGAHRIITDLINAGKLSIFDSNDCRDFSMMMKIINEKKTEKTMVMIDGVLLIEAPSAYKTELERCEYRANEIKRLAVKYMIPFLTSHELTKKNDRKTLTLEDLKGSGRFGYNANFVVFMMPDEKNKNIVNAEIVKNKITSTKKKFKIEIYPEYSRQVYHEF